MRAEARYEHYPDFITPTALVAAGVGAGATALAMRGGGAPSAPSVPEPTPPPPPEVEKVVPVQKVSPKEEEDIIRKELAKRRRATLLAKGLEAQPSVYRQKLGAGI